MERFDNHTFVICAYKESPYLEECIKSLLNQKVKSNIIMSTSTPNDYVKNLAEKYDIKLYINTGKAGIGEDWNFGVSKTKTDYVTIAHQDDVYDSNYTKRLQEKISKNKDIIFLFTNYKEIRNGKIVRKNKNLIIKSILLFPLTFSKKSKWAKKIVLKFGNPICCPSVCLNIKKLGKSPFKEDMNSNIDWGTWLEYSDLKGSFIYINENLVFHRIHRLSETSICIENSRRYEEDYEMFCRMWPKAIAKFLMLFYRKAGKSNYISDGGK